MDPHWVYFIPLGKELLFAFVCVGMRAKTVEHCMLTCSYLSCISAWKDGQSQKVWLHSGAVTSFCIYPGNPIPAFFLSMAIFIQPLKFTILLMPSLRSLNTSLTKAPCLYVAF